MAEYLNLFKRGVAERQRLEELATLVATGDWLPLKESDMFREEAGDPVYLRAQGREVEVPFINPEQPELGRDVYSALRQLNNGNTDVNYLGLVECKFNPIAK